MQKLLILSRPVFFVGMFLGSQLYGAAELGRYMMKPLAVKLRQEGSVVRQLGGKGFDFLGSRLSPGVHDMQQTILNFGSTHADALREAADSFQKGFSKLWKNIKIMPIFSV